MTTTTPTPSAGPAAPAARRPARTGGRALRHLTVMEARLLLRDRGNAFFALVFPALLLLGLGTLIPADDAPFAEADPALAGVSFITAYTPVVLALAIGTATLSTFPTTFGGYREKGILRRLSTTPTSPQRLLTAQVLVTTGTLLVASVLAVVIGVAVLDVGVPDDPGVVVAALVLGAAASLAIGCLVASRAATAGAATAMGMLAWTVSMFFAGVWFPLPLMPEVVQTVSAFTPIGAASQAMATGWYGTGVPAQEMLVMGAWALVCVPLAARLFRWS